MNLRRACRVMFCLSLLGATSALASWTPNGNLIAANSSNPAYLAVAPDGSGGALLAWQQLGQGAQNDIYAQRIDANGNPLWGANGIAVCDTTGYQSDPALVSDGAGGAIVVWSDGRNLVSKSPLYAQRINAAGTAMWTRQGIRISGANAYQEVPSLTTDGAGGAVAVWMDTRFGDYDIMAQRVESNGTISWGLGDRIVAFDIGRQTGPQIVRDGAGGYVVVWTDTRNGGDFDIYANRLNSNGLYSWAQNGVPVCVDANPQFNPQLVPDNTGGAIFVWEDYRSGGSDIYAQRINGLNVAQWAANGIAISDAAGSQEAPQVAADGSGGMFLGWHDSRNGNYDIYVQHLNTAGTSAWTLKGLAVCTAVGNQLNPRVVPDGSGGILVAWGDARSGTYSDLYVDRVRSNASLASGGGGLPLAVADYDQQVPKLVPDPSGGAIVAWEDKRYSGGYPQIYAQRFLVATTGIAEKPQSPFPGILTSAPNPFRTSTEIKFTLSSPGKALLEVFDLSGRKMRVLQFEAREGLNEIPLQREDLAPGLYFYRVSLPGFSETRKLVVTD